MSGPLEAVVDMAPDIQAEAEAEIIVHLQAAEVAAEVHMSILLL